MRWCPLELAINKIKASVLKHNRLAPSSSHANPNATHPRSAVQACATVYVSPIFCLCFAVIKRRLMALCRTLYWLQSTEAMRGEILSQFRAFAGVCGATAFHGTSSHRPTHRQALLGHNVAQPTFWRCEASGPLPSAAIVC